MTAILGVAIRDIPVRISTAIVPELRGSILPIFKKGERLSASTMATFPNGQQPYFYPCLYPQLLTSPCKFPAPLHPIDAPNSHNSIHLKGDDASELGLRCFPAQAESGLLLGDFNGPLLAGRWIYGSVGIWHYSALSLIESEFSVAGKTIRHQHFSQYAIVLYLSVRCKFRSVAPLP